MFCSYFAHIFLRGTTHFCEPCHQKAYQLKDTKLSKLPKCPGKETCPLRCEHPPTGTEFSLGCGICNNDASLKRGGKTLDSEKLDDEAGGAGKGKEEAGGDGQGGLINGLVNAAGDAVEAVKGVVRRSSRIARK